MENFIKIPLRIRTDEQLSGEAKLLYGDILTLSNTYGHCFASSDYLGARANKSRSQVQRLLKELEDGGHILRTHEGNTRYVAVANMRHSVADMRHPDANMRQASSENATGTCSKSATHNRKEVNRKDNKREGKRKRFSAPTLEEVREYASLRGLPDYSDDFIDYWTSRDWVMGGNVKMKSWAHAYSRWCRNETKTGSASSGKLMTYSEMVQHATRNRLTAGSNKHYEPVPQGKDEKPMWKTL